MLVLRRPSQRTSPAAGWPDASGWLRPLSSNEPRFSAPATYPVPPVPHLESASYWGAATTLAAPSEEGAAHSFYLSPVPHSPSWNSVPTGQLPTRQHLSLSRRARCLGDRPRGVPTVGNGRVGGARPKTIHGSYPTLRPTIIGFRVRNTRVTGITRIRAQITKRCRFGLKLGKYLMRRQAATSI